MASTDNATRPLKEVLYDFSLAQDVPDADLLDDFVRLYPCYANELTQFAIDAFVEAKAAADETVRTFDEASVSPAVSRAMSAFQVALQEKRGTQEADSKSNAVEASVVENPFAHLSRPQFRELAASINANTVFLCKLRDCLVDPATITDGFLRYLSDKSMVAADRLASFFRNGTPQLAGQLFKADEKPAVGQQQSFADAVSSSKLTEEQQDFLLNL